ncbi:unnamed protein product [Adineta steineri]|uniref:PARP catalytic domain-containing protein n=1 Tax=Adineta steineri TaxID=433720 RepID=A0A816DT98_9BILA|nr:unnamed protein product [Adineta steineri]CAF1637964.1 unnamed protein product [Adineta steineri]
MLSDSDDDDDWPGYTSSQNYCDIDYQIDLFEMHQSIKRDKYWKQKRNQSLYPISTKKLQSHAVLLKICCKRYKQKPKIEQKSFGYQHFSSVSNKFECDEEFLVKTTNTESKKRSKSSKKLTNKDLTTFSNFRAQFYQKHHENIKSSLNNRSDIKIINIRLAPINESIQIEFMKRLNQNNDSLVQLVYHGTHFKNIESILRFGFLIPNQVHPTIKNAPIIRSVTGQAFSLGIYCSRTAHYSLSYTRATNTILACAAISNYNQVKKIQYYTRNILVVPHELQIIPLFLIDFSLLNGLDCDCSLYPSYTQLQTDKIQKEKQPMIIAKQILRKVLSCMNNRVRKNQRYQIRLSD